jgi:hypothetical protein
LSWTLPKRLKVQNAAADLARLDLRSRHRQPCQGCGIDLAAELLDRHPGGEMRRRRTQRVPRAERVGDRLLDHIVRRDLHRLAHSPASYPRGRQQAVVRTDQNPPALRFDRDLAVPADIRIDD